MKAQQLSVLLLILFTLAGCLEHKPTDDFSNRSAVIKGTIIHREVYPNVRELTLKVYDFRGNVQVFAAPIDDKGKFRFEFNPGIAREVGISTVEDIIVVAPGDSLHILKDFKTINKTTFGGDKAALNNHISSFRGVYLGRYPGLALFMPNEYKKQCDKEKILALDKMRDFAKRRHSPDEFVQWAEKQIEFDYTKALLSKAHSYQSKYWVGLDEEHEAYFKCAETVKPLMENGHVMAAYFETSPYLLTIWIREAIKGNRNGIKTWQNLMTVAIDQLTEKGAYAFSGQFIFRELIGLQLNYKNIDLVDSVKADIDKLITNPFISENLYRHTQKVREAIEAKCAIDLQMLNNYISMRPSEGQDSIAVQKNLINEIIRQNPHKAIYINIWSTVGGPCLRPALGKPLFDEMKNRDVVFADICLGSSLELRNKQLLEMGYEGNHYYMSPDDAMKLQQTTGIRCLPFYLLIDKNGNVAEFGNHLLPQHEKTKQKIVKLLGNH